MAIVFAEEQHTYQKIRLRSRMLLQKDPFSAESVTEYRF